MWRETQHDFFRRRKQKYKHLVEVDVKFIFLWHSSMLQNMYVQNPYTQPYTILRETIYTKRRLHFKAVNQ